MKRVVWFFALLVLAVSACAFIVLKADQGANPQIYGDLFVYGSEGRVYVYDTTLQASQPIASGSHPSIFAYKVVFQEMEDGRDVIKSADAKKLDVRTFNLTGRHPNIYSERFAFSAKESELDVDYNNDGDLDDNIILYYDLAEDEVSVTKAVGDHPFIGKDYIVFETSEEEYGNDLTGDRDTDDTVIRSFDFRKRGAHSSGIEGERPVMTPDGIAVFSSDGELIIYDVGSGEITRTGLEAENPWIYEDTVIFSHDGELATYGVKNGSFARLGIPGNYPTLFGLTAAFVEDGMIRFLRAEDLDEDSIADIVDNCVHVSNINQTDSDDDGYGDKCDKETVVKTPEPAAEPDELVHVEMEKNATQEVLPAESEKRGVPIWLVIVILIPLVIFGIWYAPRWIKKKRKSFGF